MNHNCIILDGAKVEFGDNVFIAPNCGFYTAGHPLDYKTRNKGLELKVQQLENCCLQGCFIEKKV